MVTTCLVVSGQALCDLMGTLNRSEYFGPFFFLFKEIELAKYSDSVSFHRALKALSFQ